MFSCQCSSKGQGKVKSGIHMQSKAADLFATSKKSTKKRWIWKEKKNKKKVIIFIILQPNTLYTQVRRSDFCRWPQHKSLFQEEGEGRKGKKRRGKKKKKRKRQRRNGMTTARVCCLFPHSWRDRWCYMGHREVCSNSSNLQRSSRAQPAARH